MAAAILLFCFQGAGRKLSTECRPVVGSRPSWRPIAGKTLCLRYGAPTFCPGARPGHRPSWRSITGKALCLRYGAPTFYPEDRPGIAHVGALLPANPVMK